MKPLLKRLRAMQEAIAKRWLQEIFATYPEDTSRFLKRQQDDFANPVGRVLRNGTAVILEGLLSEDALPADEICRQLNEIIKIRAIQDFSPSKAVSFVFLLKSVIREEFGSEAEWADALVEMDRRVDQVALFAFDIYVRCREQFYELRVNEVKRNVAGLMRRWQDEDPTVDAGGPGQDVAAQ